MKQVLHKPSKILIYGINYAPEPIGVGKYSGELGVYLVEQGVELSVVTAVPHYPGWSVRDGYKNWYLSENIKDARVVRCPLWLTKNMRGLMRAIAPLTFALTSAPVVFWRILRDRPDTVLCVEPTLFVAPVALLLAKLVGARTVLHVQDLEIDAAFGVRHLTGGWLQSLAGMFERKILKSFDAVVTISMRMEEKLSQKGVHSSRLSVIRNWISLETIKPLDGISPYLLELGIPADAFVTLYSGNIGAKQSLGVVLEAAAHMAGEHQIYFVICGEGPEKAKLQAQYGHLQNVRFLPIQPIGRLCELLNLADVHLLPQDRGAADLVLPSKLGGMLASGKPCIVMADRGTELYDFLDGIVQLLPPGDVVSLVDAIRDAAASSVSDLTTRYAERLALLSDHDNLATFKRILVAEKDGRHIQTKPENSTSSVSRQEYP